MAADESLRPMRLFIAARSRFSEDTMANCVAVGVRQVVVLGAGRDTFSLRNPFADLGVRVFEVDYAATIMEAGADKGGGSHRAAVAYLCAH
jgi:O-methyltransferase involved in polyketide biosynthesis